MSNFKWIRKYVGPVKGLVLDFSGTTWDKYAIAPALVFQDVFKRFGVEISLNEVRGPMGMRKDLHIRALLLQNPAISARWKGKYGRDPTDEDVKRIFRDFVPMQLTCLRKYGTIIPGTAEVIAKMRRDFGVKVGVSTGFTRVMVDVLLEEAKKQGLVPDAVVAGDDVKNGVRPKPFMIYRNMDLMDVSPIQSVVKVDDTTSGIEEGINAGCWAVGVSRYSNHMGINSLEEESSMSSQEIERRLENCRNMLRQSGAHYVIDDITALPDVLIDINTRLANGESPP